MNHIIVLKSLLLQGEAMVVYEDPEAAKAAINWFNGMYVTQTCCVLPVSCFSFTAQVKVIIVGQARSSNDFKRQTLLWVF